jgi:hypothetical protein
MLAADGHPGAAVGVIETDYLVVGAGASGMAFTDALIADSDADVVMVDRRHRPGGHWTNAYPFVRLHQPSAYYGVNSSKLGHDRIDETGPNAGFYERATSAEICAYYERVLADRLLPSGRVRFFGMSDYTGNGSQGHRFVSLLTGDETTVRVRRSLVDATYLESAIPATHTPSFAVDDAARMIPPNDLVASGGSATGYTVIGSGKTGMDTCSWLLDNGVPPERIRWIKPRESWALDRASLQPLDQVTSVIEGVADDLESAAHAEGVEDLFRRLEACGQLVRVDRDVQPTMYRGATLSTAEIEHLRSIEHVVRKGRVRRIGVDEIVMEDGSVPTERGHVHVDCTAAGLPTVAPRPIFEADRITVQTVRIGLTPFNAAVIGHMEATRGDVAEKNRLCPANFYPDTALDWMATIYTSTRAEVGWGEDPDMPGWLERSRLNLAAGMRRHLNEPRMQSALTRLLGNRERALANLERLIRHCPNGTS